MITGKLKLLDEFCLFEFDQFILKIFIVNPSLNLYSKPDLNFEILTGNIFNNQHKYIIFDNCNIVEWTPNILTFNVISYYISDDELVTFDKISFFSDELDWFFNIRQGLTTECCENEEEIKLVLKSQTIGKNHYNININDKNVEVSFGINKQINLLTNSPVILSSSLSLIFQETQKNDKTIEYYYLIYYMLCFITYRRNVNINGCELSVRLKNGKYRQIGYFHTKLNADKYSEDIKYKRDRIITIDLLQNSFSQLIELLYSYKLYTQHIPFNSRDYLTITPSRFVLVTAAFEWTFSLVYGADYNISDSNRIKEEILRFVEELINKNTGKLKKRAKTFKRLIENTRSSLSDKIEYALNDHIKEIKVFIDQIYSLNHKVASFDEIAERIQTHRNNFAHGNIDQLIDPDVILDHSILEYLVYALILRKIGMNENDIKKSINKLFGKRIAF